MGVIICRGQEGLVIIIYLKKYAYLDCITYPADFTEVDKLGYVSITISHLS